MGAIDDLILEAQQYEDQEDTRTEELVQHLSDLGYLQAEHAADNPSIQQALYAFESEIRHSSLFTLSQLNKAKQLYEEGWLLQLLRRLVDLDEGLELKSLPEAGRTCLEARMINYRLGLLGLWEHRAIESLGELTTAGLQKLQNYGRFVSRLEAINSLADIQGFTQRMIQVWGGENMISVFYIENHQSSKQHVSLKFRRRFKKDFGSDEKFYNSMLTHVLQAKEKEVDYSYLDAKSKTDLNHFLIRLLQVHQWADGTYSGLLDGDLGEKTMDSLRTMVEIYNEDEDTADVKFKELVAHVGQGFYVMNTRFLLKHYMTEKSSAQRIDTEELFDQLNTAKTDDQEAFMSNMDEVLVDAQQRSEEEIYGGRRGVLKRVYYGVSRVFRQLFAHGKKFFRWVVKGFKKMFGFLRDLFAKVLKVAGNALKMFLKGLLFLVGRKPVVSHQGEGLLLSQIQLGGDSFTLASNLASAKSIIAHSRLVSNTLYSLGFCLEIVEQVIKLLKYLTGVVITWPLFLIQLFKAFKEISEKYKLVQQ